MTRADDGFGGGPGRFEEIKDEQKYRGGNKVREQFKLEIKIQEPSLFWTVMFTATDWMGSSKERICVIEGRGLSP